MRRDILSVQKNDLLAFTVLYGDFRFPESFFHTDNTLLITFIARIQFLHGKSSADQKNGDGTIHSPGIDIDRFQFLRNDFGDCAFPGTGRAVNGNIMIHDNSFPGVSQSGAFPAANAVDQAI